MGEHLIKVNGKLVFQSDKYRGCPPGKVPLSTSDPDAQDLLFEYAQRHRKRDVVFSDDVQEAVRIDGYVPTPFRGPRLTQIEAEALKAMLEWIQSPIADEEPGGRLREAARQLLAASLAG